MRSPLEDVVVDMDFDEMAVTNKKKRKVDVAALQSEFKRSVPSLDLTVARDLLDCGFVHTDELRGRSPEVLFEQIKKRRPETPADHLWSLRMMVYFSETPQPNRNLMHPHMWQSATR
jgi:hypothetical protein